MPFAQTYTHNILSEQGAADTIELLPWKLEDLLHVAVSAGMSCTNDCNVAGVACQHDA